MGSRLGFDDFIESLEWDKDLNEPHSKNSSEYVGQHPLTASATHMNDAFDTLSGRNHLDQFGNMVVGPNQINMYDRKGDPSLNNSSITVTGTSAPSGSPSLQHEEMHPAYLHAQEQTQTRQPLDNTFTDTTWWDANGTAHSSLTPSEPSTTHEPPAISTSLADPVINVVAPDEVSSEPKHYDYEAFPMYSVDGVPIQGSHVPEFQQPKTEVDATGTIVPGMSPSLNSSVNSSSTGATPYGTPQASPMIVFGSPNSTSGRTGSSVGSPVTADGPRSPYEAPFYGVNDGGLSPLIDDDEPIFEPTAAPLSYSTQSNSLGVPPSSRNKSRALSDSWNPQERDAFLESIDAQTRMAHDHSLSGPNHGLNGPVGVGCLMPDAVSQIQFPSYTPVHVRPHSPNVLYAGGSSTSGESRGNSSASSVSSSGAASPNANISPTNGQGYSNDAAGSAHHSPQLSVPVNTRGRSLSSPYEHTNDLKAAQMFSCELCGKRFTRAYNLRSHMRTHTDERPFACQHCGKAFARQHDRKRHEALHSGEKRFACYGLTHGFQWGCRKRFARADALGRHFRTEAGKNCLRPLIDRICANGNHKESAPEGILLTGFIDTQPQLVLSLAERDSNSSLSSEEREEQTRRTVIVTAVTEQFHELVGGSTRH